MPFMKKVNGKSVRDYHAELQWEKKHKPARAKQRAERNTARARAGLKVGDPRVVDHKKELIRGGSNSKSNIQVISAKANLHKEALRKKREAKK